MAHSPRRQDYDLVDIWGASGMGFGPAYDNAIRALFDDVDKIIVVFLLRRQQTAIAFDVSLGHSQAEVFFFAELVKSGNPLAVRGRCLFVYHLRNKVQSQQSVAAYLFDQQHHPTAHTRRTLDHLASL